MQRSRRAVFGFGRWCWSSALEDVPRFVVSAAGGAAAVVLAVGVAGYYNQRDTDDDAIAVDPITSFVPDEDGLSYVALGESYSAGEGLEARIAGPDGRCHRSADAYPLFVARALGGVRDPGSPGLSQARLRVPSSVHLEFRACAGAVSADIDLGLVGGWPAQIDAEPRPDVDLVTITIGGNDVIFSDVVQACMLYDDCLSDTFVPRDLDRSRPSIGYPPVQDLEGWAHAAITRVKVNLTRVYGNLRATYPNARIVVIGYPYLFHGGPARQSLPDLDCWTVMRRISEGERSGIRSLTDELNDAIVEVINRHRRLRIEFVSTVAAWHRHEPCADWGQYTNAVKPTLQLLSPVDGGSFHPNDQGHRQIARLLSCYLNEVAKPPVTGARIRQAYGSAEPAADVEENAAQACDVLLAVERND